MKQEYEKLPSGKVIIRRFGPAGELIEETHSYGLIEIGHSSTYSDGKKVDEAYFVKKRLVRRARYEKERAKYPDMPPADTVIEDGWAPILDEINRQTREHTKQLALHKPDPAKAQENDDFCNRLMQEGDRLDAIELVKSPENALGEMSNTQSKRLIARLSMLGAIRIHACKVDRYDDDVVISSHLVIELPADKTVRNKLFRELHKLAEKDGYRGDMDDGQKFAYAKLG